MILTEYNEEEIMNGFKEANRPPRISLVIVRGGKKFELLELLYTGLSIAYIAISILHSHLNNTKCHEKTYLQTLQGAI